MWKEKWKIEWFLLRQFLPCRVSNLNARLWCGRPICGTILRASQFSQVVGSTFFWLLDVTIVNMWKIHQVMCVAKGLIFYSHLVWGPLYTTVEKSTGRSRISAQNMVIWGNGWYAGEDEKTINYFLKLEFFGGQVYCLRLWGCPRNLTSGELPLQESVVTLATM